jgi:hypothetical protein
MRTLIALLFIGITSWAQAQKSKPTVKVESVPLTYQGKQVKASLLTVSSTIPMDIENAWRNVKTPALLEYVAKGMIRFKPTEGALPEVWEVGKTYGVKMRFWGVLSLGGTHHLYIEKVDDASREIATIEWDNMAKVWNHQIVMKDLGEGRIYYEDSILIYGGLMTGFITSFAKIFYKHRQKRWQKVSKAKLFF